MATDLQPSSMKVLAIDIETTPILAWTWGLWDQNISIGQIVKPTEMLCFGAKWVGEDSEVEFVAPWSSRRGGRDKMIKRAWALLDEADVVLHYNGARFDVPHIQREFLVAGLNPTSPFKQIDLIKTCRQKFKFPSNKLDYVTQALSMAGKQEHEGFKLWIRCMEGDAEARERMRGYNVQDVVLLEDLYHRLLPWIPSHPSRAAYAGADVCPKCGSDKLVRQGLAVLRTGSYQRLQCKGCGSWSRATKKISGTKVTEFAG